MATIVQTIHFSLGSGPIRDLISGYLAAKEKHKTTIVKLKQSDVEDKCIQMMLISMTNQRNSTPTGSGALARLSLACNVTSLCHLYLNMLYMAKPEAYVICLKLLRNNTKLTVEFKCGHFSYEVFYNASTDRFEARATLKPNPGFIHYIMQYGKAMTVRLLYMQ